VVLARKTAHRRTITGQGYDVLGSFRLPEQDWRLPCYKPLLVKLDAFEAEHRSDAKALQIAREAREEVALFRNNAHAFGYVFYAMRPRTHMAPR
jgi:hypothetical protein